MGAARMSSRGGRVAHMGLGLLCQLGLPRCSRWERGGWLAVLHDEEKACDAADGNAESDGFGQFGCWVAAFFGHG